MGVRDEKFNIDYMDNSDFCWYWLPKGQLLQQRAWRQHKLAKWLNSRWTKSIWRIQTVVNKKAVKFTIQGTESLVIDYYIDTSDRVVYVNFEVPLTKTDNYQPLVDGMARSAKKK